jgi:hypothetical protein
MLEIRGNRYLFFFALTTSNSSMGKPSGIRIVPELIHKNGVETIFVVL